MRRKGHGLLAPLVVAHVVLVRERDRTRHAAANDVVLFHRRPEHRIVHVGDARCVAQLDVVQRVKRLHRLLGSIDSGTQAKSFLKNTTRARASCCATAVIH